MNSSIEIFKSASKSLGVFELFVTGLEMVTTNLTTGLVVLMAIPNVFYLTIAIFGVLESTKLSMV